MENFSPEEILQRIREFLASGEHEQAAHELSTLLSADQAELFSELTTEEQQQIIPLLDNRASAEILEEMEEDDAAEFAMSLSSETLAQVLDEMSPDTAADILGDMPTEQATSALLQMEEAEEVAELLQYPDDTAGGLMSSDYLSFFPENTTEQVIATLRAEVADDNAPYYLYITDHEGTLIGTVGLRALIIADPKAEVRSIMDERVISVSVSDDQETVAQLVKKYRLGLIPVTDPDHKLVGIIYADDIVFVLEEEATEDILRLSSVSTNDLSVWSPVPTSIHQRLPWLVINLFTAFLAAAVVNVFEDTISRLAVLAVFQGIIAGQGGNAATQTLALIVRGIAMGEATIKDTWDVLVREILIGAWNGVAIGILVGVAAWYWKDMPLLGVLVAISMLGNMVAAGIAGTLVPFGLRAVRLDPALASAVIVTTVTDCVGFGLFLWLAKTFL